MTPLHIEIMLHYYAMGDDFRDGDFTAPTVREFIDWLDDERMIVRVLAGSGKPQYRITDKGRAYVDYLCSVPLPKTCYVIKQPESGKYGGFATEGSDK